MGRKNPSDIDLDEAVRELGGDAEDLKLVADADFSGSDYEDNSGSKKDDKSLADDVEKMWKELNGERGTTEKNGQKKKNVTEKPAENIKEKVSDNAKFKKDQKPAEKPAKEELARKPRENIAASDDRKQTKRTDSRTPNDKPKFEKAPAINKSKQEKVVKPKAPPPLSNKARKEWEQYINSLKNPYNSPLLDSEKQWYELVDASPASEPETPVPAEFADAIKTKAQELLDAENQVYYKGRLSNREFTSSLEFLKSGTFSDQLGTLSILSTESPIHSVRFLETLAAKCEIKNRESACRALEVTKDLLVSHVLPNRRLSFFKDQPLKLGTPAETLIVWSFEDFLKRYFFRLLRVMETLLADTVENIRSRTLNIVFAFFQQKPEQEANLLRLALNKLGDPAGKVASRVKRLLMDVLQMHPGMKTIVASAMAELLNRTSDYRTRYYAVDTLTEFILSNRDPALANQLIYIYLGLFERLLSENKNKKDEKTEKLPTNGKPKNGKRFRAKRGKKGGLQQTQLDTSEAEAQRHARLVSKIFTGLNRAFPFSNIDPKIFEKYTDTLYHMSHSPNVGTFIEALSFIFQLSKSASSAASSNRYYRALYESLLDERLARSAKLAKYIHLLLRSLAELKTEEGISCSNAIAKRALQTACNYSEIGAVASLIHVANLAPFSSNLVEKSGQQSEAVDEYDPKKRDPQWAKAETSHAWELLLLQKHFHPTVSLYANNMLAEDSEKLALDMPDIEQYTVNSFLSKWSYKKPKAKESTRGSIFQPLSGFTDLTLGIRQQKKGDDTPASVRDWKSKKASDIAPEEVFLYEYFSQRPDKKKKTKESEADKAQGSDIGSDDESLGEDEINEAMSKSGPGDFGGLDLDASDLDGDSDEGDLEEELAKAFNSDDLGSESGDQDGSGSEGEFAGAEFGEDISGDDLEEDGDADADDDEDLEENPTHEGLEGEFAKFDGLGGEGKNEEETTDDRKKRKRAWSKYPTFLDADAFEEMYSAEAAPKKSKHKKRH